MRENRSSAAAATRRPPATTPTALSWRMGAKPMITMDGGHLSPAGCGGRVGRVRLSRFNKRRPRVRLNVNGRDQEVTAPDDMPLLWVLRDLLGLTGTKYGCGMSLCGACTVHIDGKAVRSCSTPVSAAAGKRITTIEGLSADGSHPVQRAWAEIDVVQCGYCQPGQIMSAVALLKEKPKP